MPAAIDQKLKEDIIAEYAVSNSINSVRRKYDVSWATVRKIVKEAETQINALRDEKQKKYIQDAWEVVNVYVGKLLDPKTVKEAKARDCAAVIIGMLERIQKQQELNQQFDTLYYNIAEMVKKNLLDEVIEDEAAYREVMRVVDDYWKKRNEKDRELIREKIKKGEYVDNERTSGERERLSRLYDEVKTEILNDLFEIEG